MRKKIEVVVAMYAAVLATASFGWQVLESVKNRPALQVGGKGEVYKVQTFGPGQDFPVELHYDVPLLNVGSKALTVYDVVPIVEIRNPDGTPGPFEFTGMPYKAGMLPMRLRQGEVGGWSGLIGFKTQTESIQSDTEYKATIQLVVRTTAGDFSHQEELNLRYVDLRSPSKKR